jgi:hypothetical protein
MERRRGLRDRARALLERTSVIPADRAQLKEVVSAAEHASPERLEKFATVLQEIAERIAFAEGGQHVTAGTHEPQFDVCLSFAGEQRAYVEKVVEALRRANVRFFYDRDANLWGRKLDEHLPVIYRDRARYCVVFVSKEYRRKRWTTRELRSALERAVVETREYILPARFDDTRLPGLDDDVAYVDLRHTSPEQLARLIVAHIGHVPDHDVFKQLARRAFQRLAEEMDDIYVEPLPRRIEKNVRTRYVRPEDELIALISNAHSAEDGIAVLTSGVVWRNDHRHRPERLSWRELRELKIIGAADDDVIRVGRDYEIDLSGSDAHARPVAHVLRQLARASHHP